MVLLIIYLFVGGISALTNFGKWLFSSSILCWLFLPFMVIYFLIYGNSQRKKEAVTILKGGFVVALLYLFIVGSIFFFKN